MSLTVNEIQDEVLGHIALVSDGENDIAVTLDYGPRIVSVANRNGKSMIYNDVDDVYCRCHGHKMRLTLERSTNGVYCDDLPVRYSPMSDGVRFVQTITDPIALELYMDVVPSSETGGIMIVHSVLNKSNEDCKLSIYTETPFKPEGFVFVPQSNVPESEKPARVLTLWHGVKWTDPRLYIGDQYVFVSPTNDTILHRLKTGSNNTAGWCGCTSGNSSFIIRYVHSRSALYPFSSCSSFATSCSDYMSIQTTSPFYRIAPGETARHVENWIMPEVPLPLVAGDEKGLDDFINSI